VVPDSFTAFFAASAGVAGALVGLLFVAISVAPSPAPGESRVELDVRAGVAFSALTDALAVSLFALIPGIDLGLVAVVVAGAGLGSCAALGVMLARSGPIRGLHRPLRRLAAQAVAFVLQLVAGVQLLADTHQASAVRSLAVLTVVFFLVGIARAWQLIGARETGLFHVVGSALRERNSPSASGGRPHGTTETAEAPVVDGPDPDLRS